MGGSDEKDNIVELSIEEHAMAHKTLWEEHGRFEDYLAWQGLSGMTDKQELIRQRLSYFGSIGARKANMTRWGRSHSDGISSWKRKTGYPMDVDGRKTRTKRFWFNNGKIEGQFSLDSYPEGWSRGRLKSVMKKVNPHVQL